MINPAALLSLLTIDEVLTAHIWCQEMQVFRCKEFYRQTGRYLEKFANILDLKGFHLEQRRGLKFTKSITALDARMYPERMAVMYIINAPVSFCTQFALKAKQVQLAQNLESTLTVLQTLSRSPSLDRFVCFSEFSRPFGL